MKEVNIEGFIVTGPQIRTNNALEATDAGKIGGLWARLFAGQSGPASTIYGVYSGYQSDASGDFTVTAGVKTDAAADSSIRIASGAYLAFPADGEMPGAVIEAWKTIWRHFSQPQAHGRTYATDFEEYSGPTSATVYIGINQAD